MRVETGNMDRSQYRIAVLATPDEPFDRWTGPPAWNHKVYVPHGAGCGMGHSEGVAPDVMLDHALSRGFAVMSTALEDNTENCNVVVQAESVMMAKEHLDRALRRRALPDRRRAARAARSRSCTWPTPTRASTTA